MSTNLTSLCVPIFTVEERELRVMNPEADVQSVNVAPSIVTLDVRIKGDEEDVPIFCHFPPAMVRVPEDASMSDSGRMSLRTTEEVEEAIGVIVTSFRVSSPVTWKR